MLDRAMLFVRDRLDAHLRRRLGLHDTIVILNHPGNDEHRASRNQNHIVMTLATLDLETNKGYLGSPGAAVRKNPPQRFNLGVLISANFDDYVESLKALSETILFFQATPAFQPGIHPDIPGELGALQMEIDNSPGAGGRELWNMLGASYLPSILYKMRHVTLDADQIARVDSAADQIDIATQS